MIADNSVEVNFTITSLWCRQKLQIAQHRLLLPSQRTIEIHCASAEIVEPAAWIKLIDWDVWRRLRQSRSGFYWWPAQCPSPLLIELIHRSKWISLALPSHHHHLHHQPILEPVFVFHTNLKTESHLFVHSHGAWSGLLSSVVSTIYDPFGCWQFEQFAYLFRYRVVDDTVVKYCDISMFFLLLFRNLPPRRCLLPVVAANYRIENEHNVWT